MDREKINDQAAEEVVGGSIIFNGDHTTCGRKNNHEYRVKNYDLVQAYIDANCENMCEKDMINNLVAQKLLEKI